ncbi:MAG: hypothetical protein D6732_29690 [Methanobacteriota archaeon]|nr:MAG: hypothetical protein D6732_29690 [Euryarchaeota archaeon]
MIIMVKVSFEETEHEWNIWLTFDPLEMFHRAVTRLKHSLLQGFAPIYFPLRSLALVALPVWKRAFVVATDLLILVLLTYLILLLRHRKCRIRFTKGKVPAYMPQGYLHEVADKITQPDDFTELYYLYIDSNLPIRIENFIRFKVLTYVKQRFGLYLFLDEGVDWEVCIKVIDLPDRFDEFFEQFRDIFVHERRSQGKPLARKYGFTMLYYGMPKMAIVLLHLLIFIAHYFSYLQTIDYLLTMVLSTILFYLLFAFVDFVMDKWAFSHYFSEKGVVLDDRSP